MSTTTKKVTNSTIFRLGELPKNVADRVVKLPKELADEVTTRGRDVWLAGLGALATVEEEGTSFYNGLVRRGETLVQRGEEMEKRGKARIEELKGDAQEKREQVVEKVEANVVDPIVDTLNRLGVPTCGEVKKLSEQVETLTARVNLLLARLEGEPAKEEPVIEVVAS